VCGSRIEPDGRVVITTPSPGCCVGEVLHVIGSAAEFAVPHADWVERLLHPPPASNGRAWSEGTDTADAEAALYVKLGLLPEPIVDEPPSEKGRASGDEDAPVELGAVDAPEVGEHDRPPPHGSPTARASRS
jgi:hypothetical protein